MSSPAFAAARELLLRHRTDYDAATREFAWPVLDRFNWALDWFDVLAKDNATRALWIIDDDDTEHVRTYSEMKSASDRGANFLRGLCVRRGDRVLLMLPNVVPLWEVMLAAIKLGAVIIPATTMLTEDDLRDRFDRGQARYVVTDVAGHEKIDAVAPASIGRILTDGERRGWHSWADSAKASDVFTPDGETGADDPMLLYFTSGTTAKPKLVLHTHQSYPVGHLSTMYWIGLQPGDVHWNISSPGWAKHAWSNVFAPWNAGATVLVFNYRRFDAPRALALLARCNVTTLCAPPTVWRMLILEDLARHPVPLREAVAAGEPLNPEIIDRVRAAWSLTVRDGYGQTETTAQIGNTPGQPVKPGSMGRPLPGYRVALLDSDDNPTDEGEIALPTSPRPAGLMVGYQDDPALTEKVMASSHYHTGDVASRDADGYLTYVGRADDVFKASDYRISPFELESAMIEHPAIAEAAVVPSPDPVRLAVAKAFVTLAPGHVASAELARDLFRFVRERLAPYKRVRRIEFAELPKTISGKIRRVELRKTEAARRAAGERSENEFWDEDFPELKGLSRARPSRRQSRFTGRREGGKGQVVAASRCAARAKRCPHNPHPFQPSLLPVHSPRAAARWKATRTEQSRSDAPACTARTRRTEASAPPARRPSPRTFRPARPSRGAPARRRRSAADARAGCRRTAPSARTPGAASSTRALRSVRRGTGPPGTPP
jgi:acetyl-CoA synthetase